MLRRRATFEQVEATSGQDQSSLRLNEQWTSHGVTRLPDSSSQRQIQVVDNHAASLVSRYVQDSDAWTISSGGQYSAAAATVEVREPAERDIEPHITFDNLRDRNQDTFWSPQNSKIMNNFKSKAGRNDAEQSAISVDPANDSVHAVPVWMNPRDTDRVITASTMSRPGAMRLRKELKRFAEHGTIDGWSTGISTISQLDDFIAFFSGPTGSPYAGGVFYVWFKMPEEYPFKPPICQMLTRIYHPNIDARGRICVDILYDQWTPRLQFDTILVSLASLLDEPSVTDPLVPEIAEQYLRDPSRYRQIAEDYTRKYAMGEMPQTSELDVKPWWTDVQISQEL